MQASVEKGPLAGAAAPPADARGQAHVRRGEDEPTTIVLLGPHGLAAVASPDGVQLLEGVDATELDVQALLAPEALTRRAFLVDMGGPEAVLLGAMGAYPIARGQGGEELLLRAAEAASAWRAAQKRIAHRLQIPDWLLAYADALSEATSPAQVYGAIATYVHRVVGGYASVVFLHGGPDHPGSVLAEVGRADSFDTLSPEEIARLSRPGILTAADVAGDSGFLAPLWAEFGAVYLLHAALGADAFVFVVERRRQRLFTAEDADLFRAMLRQAEAALRRIG